MGDKTPIEWTATFHPDGTVTRGASWNPLAAFDRATGKRGWFCTKVSDGCTHCYAEQLNQRLGTGHPYRVRHLEEIEFRLVNLDQPFRWKRPRKIFVNSMTDLFHRSVHFDLIDRIFAAMALAGHHVMIVLTKRPEVAAEYLNDPTRPRQIAAAVYEFDLPAEVLDRIAGEIYDVEQHRPGPNWPLRNLILGASVENQGVAIERIPHLLRCPAAVRAVSCEPLLGPLDLVDLVVADGRPGKWHVDALRCDVDERDDHPFYGATIGWVIVGGESGPRARPMRPEWARSLRDQCVSAGVPFFFKQWGEWGPTTGRQDEEAVVHIGKKAAGRLLDGREWNEQPTFNLVGSGS